MLNNPWKTIRKNIIYQNDFGYTLRDDDVITPNGEPGKYMVLESNGFATIVALTPEQELIFVEQWRYPVNKIFTELPSGHIEENEDPFKTAQRELLEEIGATSKKWHLLGSFWHGTGSFKIKHYIYLAENIELTNERKLDDNERMETFTMPFDLALSLVGSNWFDDEKTAFSILLASNFLK